MKLEIEYMIKVMLAPNLYIHLFYHYGGLYVRRSTKTNHTHS